MGAKRNLEQAKKDLQGVFNILTPPNMDLKKAETDLQTLKTFIETSKKTFDLKAKTVQDNVIKLAKGVGDALDDLDKGKIADAQKAVKDATTTATVAETAVKTAMS